MNKQDEEKRTVEGKFEKALGTISRGGAIILVGGFIAKGFGFIHQAFIAKYYGPSALGLLALALMWVTIATRFSTGGFPAALKKFLPIHIIKKDNLSFNNTVFTIFLLSLLFCIPFSILLFIFSDFIANHIFNIEDLAPILKIIAFVIPIHSLMVLIQQIFLSLKKAKEKVIFEDISFPLFRLIILGFIIIIGGNILHIAFGYLLSTLLVVIISSLIIEKKIKNILIVKIHNLKKIGFIPRSILNYSMPLLFSGALVLVFNKADIFMLGIFTSESSVGIYNFILTIATLLTIFLVSINQIFFPVISHLHAEKNINALTRVFKIALRWDFLLTFPLFIFLIVFSKPLLESFFPAYTSGWKALVILSIGMMFHTGLGPVGHTLETFGKTMFIFKLNSILVVINIILNYFLIPYYGIEGAAFATATAFSLNNIFEMWKVRKLITFKINFKTYIKYILSAIIPILIFYFIIESLLYNWFILIIVFIFSIILYITILSILRSFLIEDLYLIEIFDCIFTKIGFKKKYFKNFFRRFVK